MKKNSCTPINPKKIFMLWPKKNSYKEFDNKKNFLRLENSPPPPPPITFLMVRPQVYQSRLVGFLFACGYTCGFVLTNIDDFYANIVTIWCVFKKVNLKGTYLCEQNLGHAKASREYAILRHSCATASEYNKFPKTSIT